MKNRRFYFELVGILGFLPRKISCYRLAFLPKSALHQHPTGIYLNNERLEYLGDAVLNAIVADYLFSRFPEGDEGFMTKMRARIVKRKNLDYLATRLDIPRMIISSASPGNTSKHLYGNTLEALIGAIYLDRGYGTARRFFVRKIMRKHIDLVQLVKKDPDYKSRIIEWAQKNRIEVVFESKKEHRSTDKSPSFISTILLKGEEKGIGRGESKKEAEQRAAREALHTIHTV
ncbi:MAG: ribonuclease III [Bacteroidales bacterium]|nr:ribonuclease III [Bacteroidales bacterium]